MTRESLEKAVDILRRRAAGYDARATAIFNGRIIADELKANAREIEALADASAAATPALETALLDINGVHWNALRGIVEWWESLPPNLRQDIEGSGREPAAIVSARKALPYAATAGWQPIETAPDNGDFILGYQEGRIQETVAWDRERKFWMNGYDDKPCHPTHWKPLDNGPVSRPMQRVPE